MPVLFYMVGKRQGRVFQKICLPSFSPKQRPDLDSICLKTPITTFCWTILMDWNFSHFFGFKFWVIFPYFKRTLGSVVIIAPGRWHHTSAHYTVWLCRESLSKGVVFSQWSVSQPSNILHLWIFLFVLNEHEATQDQLIIRDNQFCNVMCLAPGCIMVREVCIVLLHNMLGDNTDQSRCLTPYFLLVSLWLFVINTSQNNSNR